MIPDLESSSHGLMLVEHPLLAQCYTKSECFHLMNCNDYSGNQIISAFIFMKKSTIVKKMIEESGYPDIKVIATGGLGRLISDSTDVIDVYDPNLTLQGMRLIYEKQELDNQKVEGKSR